MIYFLIFIILIFFIIALFSFPQFSPIPYFPSNKKDLPLILKALDIKNSQILFDLGAGDGLVIFEAAKEAFRQKLNTQFIAVEINPVLICILYIRRVFHPNRKNIQITYGNMFTMDFKKLLTFNFSLLTFYVYISPWYLEKVISNLKLKIKNFNVVSYMYPIKSLKGKEKIIQGENRIYIYF